MRRTKANAGPLADSPGRSSPPLNSSPLQVYKEHIAWLEPLSKSFRTHCEAPHFLLSLSQEGNVSVQEWKCFHCGREVNGRRKQCYLWNSEARWLKINSHENDELETSQSSAADFNASSFYGHRECLIEGRRGKETDFCLN